MKIMEKMRQKKLGNKGFSLVELIIVIAIMAILLGIVGTQVIPYLNRAREQRDMELLNAICTAAVTAYSTNADEFTDTGFTCKLFSDGSGASLPSGSSEQVKLGYYIRQYLSYTSINGIDGKGITSAMASAKGKTIDSITINFDFSTNKVTVKAYSGTNQVLEDAVSQL